MIFKIFLMVTASGGRSELGEALLELLSAQLSLEGDKGT